MKTHRAAIVVLLALGLACNTVQQAINPPEKVAPSNEAAQPRPVKHNLKARPNRTLSAKEREERREGLEAKRKLLLALQVTSFTLNEAQRIVREDRAGRE